MRPQELKVARPDKGWDQTQAAARLGVSQAYLNMLENGKRRLTPKLTRKLALTYCLSPRRFPSLESLYQRTQTISTSPVASETRYPGFAYLQTHTPKKNPSEVLLMALVQERLEARVAEALPWVALTYWKGASTWLVEQAKKLNLQNRLGFVVGLARQVSERDPQNDRRTRALRALEATLDESRRPRKMLFTVLLGQRAKESGCCKIAQKRLGTGICWQTCDRHTYSMAIDPKRHLQSPSLELLTELDLYRSGLFGH